MGGKYLFSFLSTGFKARRVLPLFCAVKYRSRLKSGKVWNGWILSFTVAKKFCRSRGGSGCPYFFARSGKGNGIFAPLPRSPPEREIYKRIRIITLPFQPDLSGRFVTVAAKSSAKVLIDYKNKGMRKKGRNTKLPYFC